MSICQMCQERGKTWEGGSDPICAFTNGKPFTRDNWNCATVNAIRDICDERLGPLVDGVDRRDCGDQKYATLYVYEVCEPQHDELLLALWVSWYKSRGRTDAMWLMNDEWEPRKPTEADCRLVIAHVAKYKALT